MSVEIHQPEIEALIQQQMVDDGPKSVPPGAMSAEEGMRRGLDDVEHGRTRPAREALDEFRQRHGIPR